MAFPFISMGKYDLRWRACVVTHQINLVSQGTTVRYKWSTDWLTAHSLQAYQAWYSIQKKNKKSNRITCTKKISPLQGPTGKLIQINLPSSSKVILFQIRYFSMLHMHTHSSSWNYEVVLIEVTIQKNHQNWMSAVCHLVVLIVITTKNIQRKHLHFQKFIVPPYWNSQRTSPLNYACVKQPRGLLMSFILVCVGWRFTYNSVHLFLYLYDSLECESTQ